MRLSRPTVMTALLFSVAAGAVLAAPPASAVGATYTVPSSINSTCTTDVSRPLQAWLNSVPSGASTTAPNTINLRGGCYLINDRDPSFSGEGMKLINRKNLTIAGSGATLRTTVDAPRHPDGRSYNRAQLWVTNGSNISVTGLRMQGYAPKPGVYESRSEFDHNLRVMGGRDITVNAVTTDKAQGDNVYIGFASSGQRVATNVVVKNSVLQFAQRHNFTITTGANITLDRNTTDINGAWVLDAELHVATDYLANIKLTNTTVKRTKQGLVAVTSRTDSVRGVQGVTVVGNKMTVLPVTRTEPILINGYSAAAKALTKNVTIDKNTLKARQYGVAAKSVTSMVVTGNTGTTHCDTASDSANRLHGLVASKGLNATVRVTGNTFTPERTCTTSAYAQITGTTATSGLTVSHNTVGN